MTDPKGLRVAVVGLGFGAEFVPIYVDHPDVQAVAICDANPERLQKVAGLFGIERQFTSVDDVIDSDEFDAVHLVSGIPDHARQTIAVLESGKHCACTVPMATSIEDLRGIVERRQPRIDPVTAANWTAAGICAHGSAMQGGACVTVPAFDDE